MGKWLKGQSGNAIGRRAEKPFSDALKMEIAAAGGDQKALREIARNLLRIACIKKGVIALPAIVALADRLDGKPAQESAVLVTKHEASDWTREELLALLSEGAKAIDATPVDVASEAPPSQSKRRLLQS
jgi:hypothetical protein